MSVQTKHLSDGLNRVLQTFKKFLPYLQNTCEYPTLSNGPIEGINNKIKVLKRNAYGYTSFTHFRNRILLMFQQLKKELSNLTLLNSFTKIVSSTLFDEDPSILLQNSI